MTSAELLDGKNAAEVIEQVKSYLLGLQDTICQTAARHHLPNP